MEEPRSIYYIKNKKIWKVKNDYQDNESLITFGDEGQTLRKDDPRTKEFINRKKKVVENRSIFEGINLSDKREESEDYEDYRNRLKINKQLNKIYKQLGRDNSLD